MFRTEKDKILVDCFAVDVFLPESYIGSEYRGASYYSVYGNLIKFYALGNIRFYKNDKELQNPLSTKTYVLGIPTVVTSKPSEISTQDVQFTQNGPIRKCIVLRYYRNDEFLCTQNTIATFYHMMMLTNRLNGGKITFIPPHLMPSIIEQAERMNYQDLRLPKEEIEMLVSERYRDPDHPSRRVRFATELNPDSDRILSYRMRDDAMQTTTFQAITHEDINKSLVASVNRKRKGIRNNPTVTERIVRSMPIDDLTND